MSDHIGSYEQHCIDFALYGDPMQEHYDHEFNAQYDRWDGWGDDIRDPEDDFCPECGDRFDCDACKDAQAALAEFEREQREREARADNSDIPF